MLHAANHLFQRVDKIFKNMDKDSDAKLTYDEFVEGSKQDPTIVQVYLAVQLDRRKAHFVRTGVVALRRPGIEIPCGTNDPRNNL